ncbi:MAG: class I SAM-dependent methyltransferase [Ignavibacteria bacterium]|jgi:ubiquinone/menaquinone biosynthesis C-methylase UbiE
MEKKIKTITNSLKDINSDSDDFYKNYWTEENKIKPFHFKKNEKLLNHFFEDKIVNKKILEIGVGGEGGIIISLRDNNEVTGVDVSDSAIKNCRKFGLNIEKYNLDTDNLEFDDCVFDIVFAFEVFEHFSNPQHAIEEIYRVLKPNGLLLIGIPTTLTYHWPRLFYPSLFEKENFKDFLLINGFCLNDSIDLKLMPNKEFYLEMRKKYKGG